MSVLLVLTAIGGLATVAVGVRMFFAGTMTDAPNRFDAGARRGLRRIIVGTVIVAGSLWLS